jgi:hypothetical protein
MISREEELGVSREYLREHFEYKDGQLIRKKDGAGDVHNDWGKGKNGYKKVNIDRHPFSVHRLIWVMHNGYIPTTRVIDHINRDKTDNRIENLRVVSYSENIRNKEGIIDGRVGILWHSRDKYWSARVYVGKQLIHLGTYKDRKDAVKAKRGADALLAAVGFSQ